MSGIFLSRIIATEKSRLSNIIPQPVARMTFSALIKYNYPYELRS